MQLLCLKRLAKVCEEITKYQILWTSLGLKSLPEKELIHLLRSWANSRHTSLTLSKRSPQHRSGPQLCLGGNLSGQIPTLDFKRVVILMFRVIQVTGNHVVEMHYPSCPCKVCAIQCKLPLLSMDMLMVFVKLNKIPNFSEKVSQMYKRSWSTQKKAPSTRHHRHTLGQNERYGLCDNQV